MDAHVHLFRDGAISWSAPSVALAEPEPLPPAPLLPPLAAAPADVRRFPGFERLLARGRGQTVRDLVLAAATATVLAATVAGLF